MTAVFRSIALAGGLALALAGCAARPRPDGEIGAGVSATPPPRGTVAVAYAGRFAEHPAATAAAAELPGEIDRAAATLSGRLGLSLDPLRPREIRLADDRERVDLGSRLVAGRRVQEVRIPMAPIAQGRRTLAELVAEGIARAAISDLPAGATPAWYDAGAPLWFSGAWDRLLHAWALSGEEIPESPSALGDVYPAAERGDPLASALLFRFLAVEFGADRIPDVTSGLRKGASSEAVLAAALESDVSALPAAFEGFSRRVAGDILDDPLVRELRAVRPLPPEARIARLSGLARRAADPYVAAALLSELALAEYQAGEVEAAASTYARLERDHAPAALHLDRDRLHHALSFQAAGQSAAAALRLDQFLAEFPGSRWRPAALRARADLHEAAGAEEEAAALRARLVEDHAGDPGSPAAATWLARREIARHRYAAARRWLRAAGGAAGAAELASVVDEVDRTGLPEAAREVVAQAIAGLDSPERGAAAAETLAAVGPLALAELAARIGAGELPALATDRALALGRATAGPSGDAILFALAGAAPAAAAESAVAELLRRGVAEERIAAATPEGSAGRAALARRAGPEGIPPAIAPLLRAERFEDRVRAAELLAAVFGAEADRALAGLAGDPSPPVRRAVASALAGRAGPFGLLDRLARDPAESVRAEAMRSAASGGRFDLIRAAAGGDADGRIRVEAAGLLLAAGEPADAERVAALLGDSDPGVRDAVLRLLRESANSAIPAALAAALEESTSGPHSMRILRAMADRAGTDFGFDPEGGVAERRRVAAAFREWWAARGAAD